jgi:excisionase family DNA binding protein
MSTAPSPWMTIAEAAVYLKRGRRFVAREIAAGRLRAARVGARRQVLTCTAWLDAWVEDQAPPVLVPMRRRR